MRRSLLSIAVVLGLATVLCFGVVPAHAVSKEGKAAHCDGIAQITATPGDIHAWTNDYDHEHVDWVCGSGFGGVNIEYNWGDNTGFHQYVCWLNCVSGGQDFYHTYTRAGTYAINFQLSHAGTNISTVYHAYITDCIGPPTYC